MRLISNVTTATVTGSAVAPFLLADGEELEVDDNQVLLVAAPFAVRGIVTLRGMMTDS